MVATGAVLERLVVGLAVLVPLVIECSFYFSVDKDFLSFIFAK